MKKTIFDALTESRATLGKFLRTLPILEAPWDTEFQKRFCAECGAANCDACANEKCRNNPEWWLTLEEQEEQQRGGGRLEITVIAPRDQQGWIKGKIGKYTFSAKVYDLPSTFGINNGRVSKLGIYDDEQRRREGNYFASCIVNYDRGWDIEPQNEAERNTLDRVLEFLEALPKCNDAQLMTKRRGT